MVEKFFVTTSLFMTLLLLVYQSTLYSAGADQVIKEVVQMKLQK